MPIHAIHASFSPSDLNANALELCDLFQLAREEDVPIAGYTIVSDGREHVAVVGPNKYKSALCLMYLMTMTHADRFSFRLTDSMRQRLADYFSPLLVLAAEAVGSPQATLCALLGRSVSITIDPKPGFQRHFVSYRTYPEIFTWAWERRDTITPASREPFLRCAIRGFFELIEANEFEIKDEPDHWPTSEWANRVLALQNRLTRK